MKEKKQLMPNLFFDLVSGHLVYNYNKIQEIELIANVNKKSKITITELYYNILLIKIANRRFLIFNASIYKFINSNFETKFFSLRGQEEAGIILGIEKMPSHAATLVDFIKKSFRGQIKQTNYQTEILVRG